MPETTSTFIAPPPRGRLELRVDPLRRVALDGRRRRGRSRARSASSAKKRRIAAASASASPGGTSRPFSPSRRPRRRRRARSRSPACRPRAPRPRVCGKFSQRRREDRRVGGARRARRTRSRGSGPRKRRVRAARASRSSGGRSSPSPAMSSDDAVDARHRLERDVAATSAAVSRPANASVGPSIPNAARSSSRGAAPARRRRVRQHRDAVGRDAPARPRARARYALGVKHVRRPAQLEHRARGASTATRAPPPRLLELVDVAADDAAPPRALERRIGRQLDRRTAGARAAAPERASPEHAGRVDDVGARGAPRDLEPRCATWIAPFGSERANPVHGIRPAAPARRSRSSRPRRRARARARNARDVGRVARRAADVGRPDARDDEHLHRQHRPPPRLGRAPRRWRAAADVLGSMRTKTNAHIDRERAHAGEHRSRRAGRAPQRAEARRRAAGPRSSRCRA